MNNPKVTVYIVNHNYEDYLLQSYYSVLYQTYRNIELIIIDNNSNAKSKELLKLISLENNIKVIFRKESDLIPACNLALNESTGEFIVRLDADDFFRKDAIEKLVNIITENNADLVYPEYFEISKSGNILNRIKHINYDNHVSLPSFPAHGACTLLRVSSLKEIGGYDIEFDRQDGYYMWIRFLIKNYKIININYPLFFYRIHDLSLSHNLSSLYEVRSRISNKVLNNSDLEKPTIDCVIPLKEKEFDSKIFNDVLNELVKSKVFGKIIIWASFDIDLSDSYKNVTVLDRKYKVELEEKMIGPSISQDLKSLYNNLPKPDYVFFRNLNTPNIKYHYFIQMRFLVSLFKHVDCVLGTTTTKEIFYKFNGSSLEPVIDDEFIKNERHILYRKIRGFNLIKYEKLISKKTLVSGVISALPISNEDSMDRFIV